MMQDHVDLSLQAGYIDAAVSVDVALNADVSQEIYGRGLPGAVADYYKVGLRAVHLLHYYQLWGKL